MPIISGPTASGKNTVGHSLALQRERCAVVDFDLVRKMFVKPHQPPWAGEEGKAQQFLGVKQVCGLAEDFDLRLRYQIFKVELGKNHDRSNAG